VKKATGFYPRVRVDGAGSGVVSQSGGVVLVETARAVGLDVALSAGLARWRKPTAVHDPAKELLELVHEAWTFAVKQALGQAAAEVLHPAVARDRLQQAAAAAIARRSEIPPMSITGPVALEVDLYSPRRRDTATLIPGVERAIGARTSPSPAGTSPRPTAWSSSSCNSR
jgi:D-amino peptidase